MSIAPFIKCSDIKKSLKFYTTFLDFIVVQAPDPNPETFMSMYARLKRENSHIHLSQHTGDGVFGNVIYIQIVDIKKKYSEFLDNGIKLQKQSGISMELVKQTWGMQEFYVTDPDGNTIRFGQPIKQ